VSLSCEQAQQSDTGMHVAGSGLHHPTAQSRIFERLFDVHSQAEDLSALSFFWSAFTFGLALETCFGMSTDSTMQSTIARTCFNNYVSSSKLIVMITRTSSVDASWRVEVRPLFGGKREAIHRQSMGHQREIGSRLRPVMVYNLSW